MTSERKLPQEGEQDQNACVDDAYCMGSSYAPWGVCGYGVNVEHIIYSKRKMAKYFKQEEYKGDPFVVAELLKRIADEKGYSEVLSIADNQCNAIFYYSFNEALAEEDMFCAEYVKEAIIDVLTEVSNESKENLATKIDIVGIGGSD